MERARRGDRSAFDELFRVHRNRVYGLAMRLTDDREAAEEVALDAFTAAWTGLAGFRQESRFSTWVCSIAVNLARQRRRSAGRGVHRYQPMERVEESERPPRHEEAIDLERALARLPERAREVLLLRHVYGFSCEEAAQAMDVTTGTIKSQTHRACALLRESLSHE